MKAAEPPGMAEAEVPEGTGPEDAIRIAPNEILATVNGADISLQDLIPLKPGQGAATLSREDYAYRLNEAIERRLVAQSAAQQGIVLTAGQQQNVEAIRSRHLADIEAYRQQGATWTSVTEEQIEFEAARAAAILLQQNLMAKAGAPPLQPSQEQIGDYYQAHRAELGELPEDPDQRNAAWQKIQLEIRRILDPQLQAEHLAWREKFLTGLKSSANINIVTPGL